jgi:hypothetical protein
MIMTALLSIGFLAIWWLGRIGFGTFIVDPAMLFIFGYFITYLIYKYLAPAIQVSAIRRFFVLLFPLSLLGLWVGVLLPYFNLVKSSEIYFGVLPQWFIGSENGNDFMWNGLGVQFIFGRLVPEELLPTYERFWFNFLAAAVAISYFPILGLGVLEGQAAALISKPRLEKLILEWFRVIATGLALSLLVAALTALVVRIYL